MDFQLHPITMLDSIGRVSPPRATRCRCHGRRRHQRRCGFLTLRVMDHRLLLANSNRNDPVIPKKKGNAMQNQGHGKSEAPFYPFDPKNVDHCWSMIKPCAAPLCRSDWASLCSVGPALVSLEQLATRGQGMDNNQQDWEPIRMGMLRLNYKPKCHLYFIICYSVYILYIHYHTLALINMFSNVLSYFGLKVHGQCWWVCCLILSRPS